MEYRQLGRTGVKVSSLCLGTMSFGWEADEATSGAMFHACRDAGVNIFDTADVYHQGESERILGRFVRDCRDEIVLCTKGYFPTGQDVNARGGSRYHLVRAVEASLRRLETDRIDVYYLHRFDDVTPIEESLRALDDMVRLGKILYIGASNYAAWQFQKALGVSMHESLASFCCIQPMYNLVKRQAEVEILPMASSEEVSVFPYSPLGGGLLTGKYGRDRRPESGRLIDVPMYGTRYAESGYYDVAERFTELANQRGHHPATLAVAWVMSHPAVTAPIIAGRNTAQLQASLDAVKIDMTEELRADISALSPRPPPATDRNEEEQGQDFSKRVLEKDQ